MLEDDFAAMRAIASRLWGPSAWWHPGGMAWQLATERDASIRHTRVWGEHAWGWMYPDVLMLQVDSDSPETASDAVEWFDENNVGFSPRVEVPVTEGHVIDALVAAGYAPMPDEPFGLDLRREAARLDLGMPEGYALLTASDVAPEVRVEAHVASWLPAALPYTPEHRPALAPDATSGFDAAKLARVQAMPLYAPERDFVITTTAGDVAACCTVWLDDATGAAEVEPLGVVPEHRRNGLAQRLCHAAVNAVAVAGGNEVVIHPRGDAAYPAPRGAYLAAGFREVNRTETYGRSDS